MFVKNPIFRIIFAAKLNIHKRYMRPTSIILAAIALWTVSCTPKQEHDPIQRNIIEHLKKTNPDIGSFVFTEYTVTDTVTTGETIDECIELHTRKAELAKSNADKFRRRHRRRYAAAWDSVETTARQICLKLQELKESSGKKLNEPLYCCIRFSGRTFSGGENFQINGYYATIDTEGHVRNLQGSANGLHNGMGILIPEYVTILEETHQGD